ANGTEALARTTVKNPRRARNSLAGKIHRQERIRIVNKFFMSSLNGRKRIVILGGGCGGVVAATHLGRKLGAAHDVILIDRRAEHIFRPAFLFVMLGERQPWDISRSLSRLQKRNVKVMQSEIRGIDPIRHEVSLEKEKVGYDSLIVSLGLQTRPDLIPGF